MIVSQQSFWLLLVGLALSRSMAWGQTQGPANAPVRVAPFELADQFGTRHSITFPDTNVLVLTVADRKGSEQIQPWVAAVKDRYGSKVRISGVADVGKVPGPLHSLIRRQFVKTCPYPVMLDWTGSVVSSFHYQQHLANVFVIERSGEVGGHFTGTTNRAALDSLFAALDRALQKGP
jgi:hypothetical protein